MKSIILILLSLFCVSLSAAEDVHNQKVNYVYQFDTTDVTMFDINIPERPHSCGTTLYRSTSASEVIANRKFTLVLMAFTANKKIAFYESGICDGNRMKIGWIRLTS